MTEPSSPAVPAAQPLLAGAGGAPAHGPARRGHLAVICATYAVAAIVFNVAPGFISALIDGYHFTETEAGLVATADMLAMAATGFLAGPALARRSRRRLLGAGAALVALGNALSVVVGSLGGLLATRVVAGVGTGLLLVFANTMAATTRNPTRSYGLATMTATVVGAFLLVVTPMVVSAAGYESFFVILAVFGAVVALFVPGEPAAPAATPAAETGTDRLSPALLRLLSVAAMAMMVVQSAFYAFAQQAGEDAGLSSGAAGAVLSVGYIGGIVTSALAAWLGNRWGRWTPVALGMVLQAAASVVVLSGPGATVAGAALIAQSATLFFGIPYLLALNAEADASGRFSNIGVGLFFLSLAVGPFVGGLLLDAFGYAGVAVAVVVGTVAGLIALAPVTRALAARDADRTTAAPGA
ncbi:MFS transporter [Streptomyces sp. NPDC051940]|uniref:MFS transporter n=1 Tax=Streptomyces sp. NPDC051940 TaxID=3155675 RepID=UPI00343897F2